MVVADSMKSTEAHPFGPRTQLPWFSFENQFVSIFSVCFCTIFWISNDSVEVGWFFYIRYRIPRILIDRFFKTSTVVFKVQRSLKCWNFHPFEMFEGVILQRNYDSLWFYRKINPPKNKSLFQEILLQKLMRALCWMGHPVYLIG